MSSMSAPPLEFAALPLSQPPSQPYSIRLCLRLRLRSSPVARARSPAPRATATAVSTRPVVSLYGDRDVVRLGLPSKGRMAEQTLSLLKSCQLAVRQLNPRQYTADIPLLGAKFLKEKGLKHVLLLSADGALESFPPMGMADAIVDLVSSGTTLRENNLKEIEGSVVLESQATLVASRKSLHKRKGVLDITHELLERLEAHLRASAELMVTANMRGNSAEEVAERVLSLTSICGLQGPTISSVYCRHNDKVAVEYYALNVVVPQKLLYKSIQELRSIGGSGVLVTKLTYIFDEETPRWRNLLSGLGL